MDRLSRILGRRPRWAVETAGIVLVFLIVLHPTQGFKNAVVWIAFLFTLIPAALNKRRVHMGGLGPVIFIYLGAALISSLFSIERSASLSQWIQLIELVAGYVVIVNLLSSPRRLERSARWFFAAMGMLAFTDLGRFAWMAANGEDVLSDGRWFGSLIGFPTIAAGVYASSVLVGIAPAVRAQRSRSPIIALYGAMFLALGALLYLLQTRSVLLGLLCGIIVILVLAPMPRRCRLGIIAVMVISAALFLSIPGDFHDRIASREDSGRTEIRKDVLKIIHSGAEEAPRRLWVGFGYGHKRLEALHASMPSDSRTAPIVYDHAHNMFLEKRVQSGYLGLLAWIALLIMTAYRLSRYFPRREDYETRLIACCYSGAILSLVIYGQFSLFFARFPALLFWSLLGACMASCRRARDKAAGDIRPAGAEKITA